MILNWSVDYVDNGNRIFEAASPYHDEGDYLCFRIRASVGGKFRLESDAELMLPEYDLMSFATLEDAKAFCQKQCDEIVASVKKEAADELRRTPEES